MGGGLTENEEFEVTFSFATEFKANVGYVRPCIKTPKQRTTSTTTKDYRKLIKSLWLIIQRNNYTYSLLKKIRTQYQIDYLEHKT